MLAKDLEGSVYQQGNQSVMQLPESPESRWRAMVAWSNNCFELFLAAQAAQGQSREEALKLLRRSWEIEDEDKIRGWTEIARLTSRAR